MVNIFEKTTLKNFLKELEVLELVREEYIYKLRIYLPNVVLIMIKILKLLKTFMRQFKINFIMQLHEKQQQKLFTMKQIEKKKICD